MFNRNFDNQQRVKECVNTKLFFQEDNKMKRSQVNKTVLPDNQMQIVIGEKLYINARTGIGKDGHIIGFNKSIEQKLLIDECRNTFVGFADIYP